MKTDVIVKETPTLPDVSSFSDAKCALEDSVMFPCRQTSISLREETRMKKYFREWKAMKVVCPQQTQFNWNARLCQNNIEVLFWFRCHSIKFSWDYLRLIDKLLDETRILVSKEESVDDG